MPPAQIPEDWIKSNIADINDEIRRFDYEIRTFCDQTDPNRTNCWAIVNLESDSFLQLATTHTADELAFFRRILDAMFDTNNQLTAEVFAVRRMDAEKLAKPPKECGTENKPLTAQDAQDNLAAFVAEGWLVKSEFVLSSSSSSSSEELRANYFLQSTVVFACSACAYGAQRVSSRHIRPYARGRRGSRSRRFGRGQYRSS